MGKEKISILVVKDYGKAKSYRISFGLFKKIVIVAIVLFLLTVASLFGFFHLYWERKEMQKGIEGLKRKVQLAKKEVKKQEKILKATRKQLASLKANPEEGSDKKTESKVPPDVEEEPADESDAITSSQSETFEKMIDVRDFRTIKDQDPQRLKVQFGLFNEDPQHRVIEGRIIMVASKDRPGSPLHIPYPWAPLSSGKPTGVRVGYRFAIRHFKQIEGYFQRPSLDLHFDKVTVFVYALNGDLILEEPFLIEDR